ncbi:MAG: hypothetical protein RL077_3821, partial [Verrucomicrobiota bacterium]
TTARAEGAPSGEEGREGEHEGSPSGGRAGDGLRVVSPRGRVRVGRVGRATAAGEPLLGFGGEEEKQFDGFAWREGLKEAGGHE